MRLPNFSEGINHKKITLLSGLNIGIRPWRVKEKKELLAQLERDDSEMSTLEAVNGLIRSCVDNERVLVKMSDADQLYIISELRKISEGENVDYSYRCPKCKMVFDDQEINLNEDIEKKPFDSSPIDVGGISFSVKELSYEETKALKAAHSESKVEYNYAYLLKSIAGFTFNGENFTNFTEEELNDCVGTMKTADCDELIEKLKAAKSIFRINSTVKCMNCQEDVTIFFEEPHRFFVL